MTTVAPAVLVRRTPSATRGRYLLIIVVLLLGGAFAGYVTHHLVFGLDWVAVSSRCVGAVGELTPDPAALVERQRLINDCRAPVEHRLALHGVAGGLLTLALAAMFTRLLPRLMLRRVGARRPAPEPLRDRAAAIAAQLGVRPAPAVEIGPWNLREPFTVRANGAIRIVLPPGVRRLPEESLDAVLRHETAHVAAGDVILVWLTRSLLWALAVVLPVPLVVAAFRGGLSDVPFWSEYVGRGALLWVAGYVLARGVMRDREHEADAHASLAGSGPALSAMFAAAPAPRPGRVRQLAAMHPPPGRRAIVLREPERVGIPAVIAAVAGALAVPLWSFGATIARSGFTATPLETYPSLVSGLLAGALLAVTWGLALWLRSSVAARPPWAATLGLAAGVAAGLLLSLDPAAMIVVDGFRGWRELVYVPLAVAGAGGCTLALAAVLSRPGATAGPPTAVTQAGPPSGAGARLRWPLTAGLSTAAFAGALWIASVMTAPLPYSLLGLPDGVFGVLYQAGFAGDWRNVMAIGVALFAVAAAAGLGRRAVPVAAFGLVAGLAALAARWLAPLSTVEPYEAAERDWWTGAAAGLAVLLLLLCLRGASGLGDALLAAPIAALTVSAGVLLRYLPDFEDPLFSAAIYASRPLSMLAVLALAVGAAAGLLPSRPAAQGRRAWPATAAGACLAAALTLAVLFTVP